MKIKVEGVAIHAVMPDSVAAHDKKAEAGLLHGGSDAQETLGRIHARESSQPRLPQANSNTMSGCRRNSSSESGPRTNSTTSARWEFRYCSCASATVCAF